MHIDNVRNADEVDSVWRLVCGIFPQLDGDGRYSRDFWIEKMREVPELLLYARDGSTICGSVFAWVTNGGVTIGHCGVDRAYRGRGVGRALMIEVERRARDLGYHGITLGALEVAEGFYERLGYTGSLLIQSKEQSVDELKSLNESYDVIGTNVYEGTISQVWLRLPAVDRELQRKYEETFPGCQTQMTYGKTF